MATNPAFSTVRGAPPWRQRLSAFWRWWTSEIAQLVPERFSLRSARVPMVALEGDDVLVVDPRAGASESRISLMGLDDARRRGELRALLERAGETRARARVALGRDEALVRRITMPAATEENLGQVLAFEMDRFTPFKADDVYYDYRVLSRDGAAGQIIVQLAVARRGVVDARVEALRALGASVQGVAVRDDAGSSGAPLDLLPSEQRGERQPARERLIHRALLAAVAAFLVIALLLPIWQKRETVIELHPLLNKAKEEAEKTDAIARELERQTADYNYLAGRKHGAPPALAYIEELSRLLPDTTWVQQLDVKTVGKSREVQLTGETTSASKLIELLELSSLLQNAAPRGSVTRGSQPGTERFMIAAETRPRPLPEARPVMELVSSIPVATPTPLPQAPPAVVPNTAVLTPDASSAAPVPAPVPGPVATPRIATETPAPAAPDSSQPQRPAAPAANPFRPFPVQRPAPKRGPAPAHAPAAPFPQENK